MFLVICIAQKVVDPGRASCRAVACSAEEGQDQR
jgi:hypothetical protein